MKRFYFPLFVFTLLIALSACENDDDNDPSTDDGVMTAKVDGQDWEAEVAGVQFIQGMANVTGIAADGKTITITLTGFEEKTYPLGPSAGVNAAAYLESNLGTSPAYTSNVQGGSGSLTITEINTTDSLVSGNFSFKGIRALDNADVEITAGTFSNLKFTTSTTPINGNSMAAKIDGQGWTANSVSGFLSQGKLNLVGTDATGTKTVAFFIPGNVTVGTYMLSDPISGTYGAQYNKDAQTFLVADSGSLKITEHNTSTKTIKGTFNFQASEFGGGGTSANLTEGNFTIKYN